MMWLNNLIMELDFRQLVLMPMYYDNQYAIYIDYNLVFHERTKHIEVDRHHVKNA